MTVTHSSRRLISAQAQILDAPKREDKYHRTQFDEMRLGDVNTDRLQHYLACRRQLEGSTHLDEESVFDELCRLSRQADDETQDVFDRVHVKAQLDPRKSRFERIRAGMLSDGWAEHEVRYALGTLGTMAESQAA
jgi:hypothetical protein